MSNAVFPDLPGLDIKTRKTPIWSTQIQTAVSGKELRASLFSYPLYKFGVSFEVLRSGALGELETVVGFFNSRKGRFDSFLFTDPEDNSVTGQAFGDCDGVTTAFALVRAYGGHVEPVMNLNGLITVDIGNYWQGPTRLTSVTRTNLAKRSEEFSSAAWTKTAMLAFGSGSVADIANAPNGDLLVADLLVPDTTSAVHRVRQGIFLFAGMTYTMSVFYFDGGYPSVDIVPHEVTPDTPITATVTDLTLPSGWHRKLVTFTVPAEGDGYVEFRITVNNGTTDTFAGDGVKGVYLWGAHCELADRATNYIKTLGAIASYTDFTVSSVGVVTFTAAPASGATLTWTGSYYYRVRFELDTVDFERFLWQLWNARSINLRGSLGTKI